MSEFTRVLLVSELAPGSGKQVLVEGKPVAVFNVSGTFYAISNTCVHRGGPLGQGLLDGCVVWCPWHDWTYDVRTGVSTVNPDLKVASYETRVEGGDVYVRLAP